MHGHLTIKTHIFLTGATGYIGGSVLARLISSSLSDTFQITVLVRQPSKAHQLRGMGVKVVLGTYSDLVLLRELARHADVVVACVDCDDLRAAKAILSGMEDRYEATGKQPSLIHTSGTGVLIDDAKGMFASDLIYNDLDISQIEELAPTQPHRPVDLAIVAADNEGYVKTHIVLPSTVYGVASGALVDIGLQNSHSQQIPALVQTALARGQAGMVGNGRNIWPNVHIDDLADLYHLLFENIISEDPEDHPSHGRSGYFFAENGEHTLFEVSQSIAQQLYQLGKSATPRPTSFTPEELVKYMHGGVMMGGNARCKAERARTELGWEPGMTKGDLLESIKEEIEHVLHPEYSEAESPTL